MFAQGQANTWYFGINAGVSFGTGTPVALTNGALATSEGCASISDEDGNLQFYTDGIYVWNRNHTLMPNGSGLLGDPSSAQSAIVVPNPGNDDRYYIFTVDATGGPNGFRYSEVDMTLAGGLGDVVAGSKNTLLFTPSVEKITAIAHANGLYIWVVGHGLNNNRYYSYLVDCDGINPPITTDVGSTEGTPGWGCLTTSPNGLRLASAMRNIGYELLDFDPATGIMSNPILLHTSGNDYGIGFSPNSEVLYGLDIVTGAIQQWNLQAGNAAAIVASRQQIGTAAGTGSPYRGGAIQQGPDGKLYIPHFRQPFLSVIHNPNTLGPACNLQHNAVDLAGRSAVLGLPPFIQSYFDTTQVISYDYAGTCQGNPTNFTLSGNTTYLDSVVWDFGDPASGALNSSNLLAPSHTYENPATYNVRVIRYIDCISDTAYNNITIKPYPVGNVSAEICADETYTLPSGGVVSTTGVYNDTVPDGLGCDSVIVTNLTVHPLPNLTTIADTAICIGQTVQLTTTGADSYNWLPATDLSNAAIASPVFNGTASNTYTVTGTNNAGGCTSTASVTITVNPLPVVDAGVNDTICNEQTVQLAASGAVSYSWTPTSNLSDANSANPVFDGAATTTFTVTGTDANGCENTDNVEIVVHPLPVADFLAPADVCLGNPTIITDNSSGNGLAYTWDFGDGTPPSTDPNPTITYASDGVFNIQLDVVDVNGCTASTTQNATVYQLPAPTMNIVSNQEFCENEVIQFTNQTPGSVASVLWDFGDNDTNPAPNTTSTLNDPSFFYSDSDFSPYTVTLTITDAAGCSEQIQTPIIINDKPVANFTATTVCEGQTTNFTDLSTVNASAVNTWQWNFGDTVGTAALANPTYAYTQAGQYQTELIVETIDGCRDTTYWQVIVNPTPIVAITGTDTCLNDVTSFTNNSSPQDATIANWNWNFGDGTTASGVSATTTYTNHGTFTVTLTATTDSGCVASGATQVDVFPNPEPNFGVVPAEGCTPHHVLFSNLSTIATGTIASYEWSLGDTVLSSETSPEYTYIDSGYYDISLTAISTQGCTTTLTQPNAVRANITPIASFEQSADRLTLLDALIELTDQSEHALTWNWSFGDGYTATETDASHRYDEAGTYNIQLIVTNGNCQDAAMGRVIVDPIYTFYIPSAFSPNNDSRNDTFYGDGEGIQSYNMRIYNRWGQLLFESNNRDYHWDGTFKGTPVESGMYTYRFIIESFRNNKKQYAGEVHLIR